MMDSEKQLIVKIPAALQSKIDSGDYELEGYRVRNKSGRIVANLKAFDTPDHLHFSPQIFVSFEQCCFISNNAVSDTLQRELESARAERSSLETKIDTVLERQTGDLIALTSEFNEHFTSLRERNRLTDEKTVFASGVKAAAALANNLDSYIKEYLDSVEVWFGPASEKIKYGEYQKKEKTKWNTVKESKFNRFAQFDINHIAYSFLSIINNLNILHIAFNEEVHSRYEKNLQELEKRLKTLLKKLILGLGEERDIFSIMFASDKPSSYKKIDVSRILKHETSISLDNLIIRSYANENEIKRDFERVESVIDIIDILDEIENLRARATSLESVELSNSTEVSTLKNTLFERT
ncbi:hypothetical protein LOY38_14950 [Pseudomonas sp. B21-015]|uniref:hypothetical protein n=1 Tax=Pseudomonas sp. B21-015 TaxID=2895473 RepID=UPI00215DE44B|nr:hypothetical protein [Pseudomonas sp. B21-015]UVM47743.1 hypothetical protein LOY38_14950 [Pseudomonas sp. B21-015]